MIELFNIAYILVVLLISSTVIGFIDGPLHRWFPKQTIRKQVKMVLVAILGIASATAFWWGDRYGITILGEEVNYESDKQFFISMLISYLTSVYFYDFLVKTLLGKIKTLIRKISTSKK